MEAKLFLECNVTAEQHNAFEKVRKAWEKVWKYQTVDQFKDGFCLGGRLAIAMMEAQVESVPQMPEIDDDE